MPNRWSLAKLVSLILLAVVPLSSCGRRDERRSVLFIIVDTLRADRLGCYGYDQIHTPYIDELASSGVRFSQVVTAAPVTAPSITTLLTSTFPPFHGVRDNDHFVLNPTIPTLASVFRDAGYATAGFVGSAVLDRKYGFGEGFDYYDDDVSGQFKVYEPSLAPQEDRLQGTQRRAEDVTKAALEWLKQNGRKKAFFCMVHYFDPHMYYDPPPPYSDRYFTSPYDGEVAYTDSQIGVLFHGMKDLDLDRNTLVVFVSDHGEGLGDHGEGAHGFLLYEATVRVPLIFSLPGVLPSGVTIPGQVRTADVMPTILELAGLPVPNTAQGESLAGVVLGTKPLDEREAYIETYHTLYSYNWHELEALRTGHFKYVRAPSPELYDLQADPQESDNLFESRPEVASQMEASLTKLDEQLASGSAPYLASVVSSDEETIRKMRALGYVGEPAQSEAELPQPGGNLPDPKDKVKEWNAKQEARGWLRTALALSHKGDFDGALNMIAKAESLAPDYAEVPATKGLIVKRSGDIDGGIRLMEAAIEQDPSSEMAYQTLNNLGLAYLEKDECDKAIGALRRSLEVKADYFRALYNLGSAYEKCGQPGEAADTYEAYLKKEVRLDPVTAGSIRKKIADLRSAAGGAGP
jgi:arylsulfatase A-like enzyme